MQGRGKRKRKIKRQEKRKRPRKTKNQEKVTFVKGVSFFFLSPGSALKGFAVNLNPENKLAKVNWVLMAQALDMCGKNV